MPTSTARSVRSSSQSISNSPKARVAGFPVEADRVGALEVREAQDVEEFGASRREGLEAWRPAPSSKITLDPRYADGALRVVRARVASRRLGRVGKRKGSELAVGRSTMTEGSGAKEASRTPCRTGTAAHSFMSRERAVTRGGAGAIGGRTSACVLHS
jgi:hypothetical protein